MFAWRDENLLLSANEASHLVSIIGYIPSFGRTPQKANVQQMKTPKPILMPVFVCSSGIIFAHLYSVAAVQKGGVHARDTGNHSC